MAHSFAWTLLTFFTVTLHGQSYFQQRVNHKIQVRLDDKRHVLSGYEEIEYHNNSPIALDTIYFHLWPNAYNSTFSALGRQNVENNDLSLHFSDSLDKGFIDSLQFSVNGTTIQLDYMNNHQDIGYIVLKKPVQPGNSITISTPFRVKIPDAEFSRLGHVGESYMITQWFPKPAVFDRDGWHPMPYLNQGEFYSEFGSYEVSIQVPKNYVVGATGDLQNDEEIVFLNQLDKSTRKKIEMNHTTDVDYESDDYTFPVSDNEYKTLRYKQDNIHDFAWFADKRFNVLKSKVELPNTSDSVTTWAMFTDKNFDLWTEAPVYLDSAIYYYSLWNGNYPYQQVTAVDGTIAAGGGMEYPNVTVIGSSSTAFELEQVIVHEVGHNWFYGILGSNERDHPWMDEGLNSFNDNRYIETKYRSADLNLFIGGVNEKILNQFGLNDLRYRSINELGYLLNARRNLDQPIEQKSQDYTSTNYGAIVYGKTALVFNYLKSYLGDSLFDQCMQQYFEDWKFKHPGPSDIRNVFEKTSGKDLTWFFEEIIGTTKKIDYAFSGIKKENGKTYLKVKNKGGIASPYSLTLLKDSTTIKTTWIDEESAPFGLSQHRQLIEMDLTEADRVRIDYAMAIPEIDRTNNTIRTKGLFKTSRKIKLQWLMGLESPQRNTLYYTPIMGWNKYDGFMAGLSLYNHTFPEKRFEYTLNPMFGFRSLQPVGIADAHYHIYPHEKSFIQRISIGSEFSSFHLANEDADQGVFQKLNPYIEFDFQKAKRRSKWKHRLKVDYNFVKEIIPEIDEVPDWTNIQALRAQYRLTNSQVLKPFSIQLSYEQGSVSNVVQPFGSLQNYLKASLEANWRINYNYQLDGIDLRIFAGNFFKNNTTSSDFNWQIDGQNGTQDYLYDQIFLGRLQTHPDLLAQQLIENHGNFKIPSRRASSTWLASGNVKIELPLPILGIYGDGAILPVYIVNKGEFENQYLFDAGLQLSIKKDLFDIYIPIFMHSDLKSEMEFQDISVLQRIRFTLNLKVLNPFKMIKQIEP
ncbi:MAG TPA: hypothetical protein DCF89_00705 [Flavobacteriales bacterium]|nr:hypothetical protein [Flavobacteriales bacterium]